MITLRRAGERTPARTMRRAVLPRQAVAWAAIAAASGLSLAAWHRSGIRSTYTPPAELDQGAAAALWAATAWRDTVGVTRTPTPVAWQPQAGYVRVTLDRNDSAGCVQVGVAVNPDGFALAGPAAPVACPPVDLAATITGADLAPGDPLYAWAARFTGDWLAGRDVSLYAAPKIALQPPAPHRQISIDRVTSRRLGGQLDVVVFAAADGAPVAVRLTVDDQTGRYLLLAVRGGLAVTPGRVVGTLIPPDPTTTTLAATTTTAVSAPPPVTAAPAATPPASSTPPPPPPGD